MLISFDSTYQWRHVVADGLPTDDVDVTVTCQIIIVVLYIDCQHSWKVVYWLGGVVVSVLDSRPRGPGFNSRPVHRQAATLGKLLTPMCLCHQAVQFGTGQRAVMLCGREGNRRSGVALAVRHKL